MVRIFLGKTVEFAANRREQQQGDEDVPEAIHGGQFKAGLFVGKREVLINVLPAGRWQNE